MLFLKKCSWFYLQALEREVQWLKDRTKSLAGELESERAKAKDKELRQKGKFDAQLEKAIADREVASAHVHKQAMAEVMARLEASQARERELLSALQQAVAAGGLVADAGGQ